MKISYGTALAVSMLLPALGLTNVSNAQQSPAGQAQSGQAGQAGQREQGQAGQTGQRDQGQAGTARQGQSQMLDRVIASMVAIGNEEEIQLAQIAATRAQSNEVKEFARELQKEHTELGQRLSQMTGQRISLDSSASGAVVRGQSPDANEGRPQQNQQNQAVDTTRDRPATPGQPGQLTQGGQQAGQGHELHQLIQIKQEVAQRCLQHAQQELQAKSGSEFDKAFMAHQAVTHGQMLAALQVYQKHTSSELSQVLAQAEQVTEKHLQHAKKLCKQLESGSEGQERSSTSGERSSQNRTQQQQ